MKMQGKTVIVEDIRVFETGDWFKGSTMLPRSYTALHPSHTLFSTNWILSVETKHFKIFKVSISKLLRPYHTILLFVLDSFTWVFVSNFIDLLSPNKINLHLPIPIHISILSQN